MNYNILNPKLLQTKKHSLSYTSLNPFKDKIFNNTNENYPKKYEKKTPQRLGEYTLGKKLGQGTFGKVVLGTHGLTGEKVAIKILDKEKISKDVDKKRLEREIKTLKIMRHNNIVYLYNIIEKPTSIYLIMEYIPGKELFDYIVAKGHLNELESCKFYQQIISGIEYLGKIKVAHRDIKPENLLLDNNKNIKIVDFGLSNIYYNNELLNTACGSPCYAAPEMIDGLNYYGLKVDIWSSGVVLYAMLCGYLPFEDNDDEKLFKKISEGIFDIPEYISPLAKNFLHCILNVNPEKRFNIEQIKNHPWFNLINQKINMSEGLLLHTYIVPIDDDIVNEMVKDYGYEEQKTKINLILNKHNYITTTYYLMLLKKIRFGINTIGDMTSQKYNEYINNPKNLLANYNYDFNKVIYDRVICNNLIKINNLDYNIENSLKSNIRRNNENILKDINKEKLFDTLESRDSESKRSPKKIFNRKGLNSVYFPRNYINKNIMTKNSIVNIKREQNSAPKNKIFYKPLPVSSTNRHKKKFNNKEEITKTSRVFPPLKDQIIKTVGLSNGNNNNDNINNFNTYSSKNFLQQNIFVNKKNKIKYMKHFKEFDKISKDDSNSLNKRNSFSIEYRKNKQLKKNLILHNNINVDININICNSENKNNGFIKDLKNTRINNDNSLNIFNTNSAAKNILKYKSENSKNYIYNPTYHNYSTNKKSTDKKKGSPINTDNNTLLKNHFDKKYSINKIKFKKFNSIANNLNSDICNLSKNKKNLEPGIKSIRFFDTSVSLDRTHKNIRKKNKNENIYCKINKIQNNLKTNSNKINKIHEFRSSNDIDKKFMTVKEFKLTKEENCKNSSMTNININNINNIEINKEKIYVFSERENYFLKNKKLNELKVYNNKNKLINEYRNENSAIKNMKSNKTKNITNIFNKNDNKFYRADQKFILMNTANNFYPKKDPIINSEQNKRDFSKEKETYRKNRVIKYINNDEKLNSKKNNITNTDFYKTHNKLSLDFNNENIFATKIDNKNIKNVFKNNNINPIDLCCVIVIKNDKNIHNLLKKEFHLRKINFKEKNNRYYCFKNQKRFELLVINVAEGNNNVYALKIINKQGNDKFFKELARNIICKLNNIK